jgi:hypothetical protein
MYLQLTKQKKNQTNKLKKTIQTIEKQKINRKETKEKNTIKHTNTSFKKMVHVHLIYNSFYDVKNKI